jgi:hypothetical protein
MLSIIRRFNAQHGLSKAPLLFVHGIIIAIDATIATTCYQTAEVTTMKGTILEALDGALAQLAHASSIASEARDGLRRFFDGERLKNQVAETSPAIAYNLYADATILEQQNVEFTLSNFQPTEPHLPEREFSAIFEWNHFQDMDRNFWDGSGSTNSCFPSWSNVQCAPSLGNGDGGFVDNHPAVGYERNASHTGALHTYTGHQ